MSELSRRDLLKYGATGVAALAATPVARAVGSPLRRLEQLGAGQRAGQAATSYSYDWWTFDGPTGIATIKQAVAAFNASGHGNLELNISSLSTGGASVYPSKIQSLISSGQPPDLFLDWIGTLASPYIDEGAVQPLGAWYRQYDWAKVLVPSSIGYVTVKGQPYGVPMAVWTVPVWYNKTLFAKAGASVPTTYDEWETVNAKLVSAGITPAAEAVIDGYDIMRLFEHLLEVTAGPKLHDELLALNASWNDPAVTEAFALLKKWGDAGWFEKGFLGTNPNDSGTLFSAGKAAQSFQGGWEAGSLESAGSPLDDFDVFVPPGEHGPARLAGFAVQYLVGKQVTGEKLDQLGAFFNWFIQPAQQKKYFYDSGTATVDGVPPATTTAGKLAHKAAAITAAYGGYVIQDEALGTELVDYFYTLQYGVLNGSMTPKEAAAKMAAQVEKDHKS